MEAHFFSPLAESSSLRLSVRDASEVGEARRRAVILATELGFVEAANARLALVISELATNLIKHGGGGDLLLMRYRQPGAVGAVPGIGVLALDKGRGMAHLPSCMRDGYSTAGSLGVGLGAIARMSAQLDIYTRPDAGTAAFALLWGNASGNVTLPDTLGALGVISLPKLGQQVCGDTWSWRSVGAELQLLLVDGLGYGPNAASTSAVAAQFFRQTRERAPAAVLEQMHAALRSTRGAVAALAAFDPDTRRLSYAGVGNIAGQASLDGRRRHLLSVDGTLGYQARLFRSTDHVLDRPGLLVMSSDGLSTRLSLDAYPGLQSHAPALIAGVLYRDFHRDNDDATIAVARFA